MQERLQKIIARAGVTSRRKAEALILAGRVKVNNRVVEQLGATADAASDVIAVDGRPLRPPGRRLYLLLNKPVGYVSTVSDPERRPTLIAKATPGDAGRLNWDVILQGPEETVFFDC